MRAGDNLKYLNTKKENLKWIERKGIGVVRKQFSFIFSEKERREKKRTLLSEKERREKIRNLNKQKSCSPLVTTTPKHERATSGASFESPSFSPH